MFTQHLILTEKNRNVEFFANLLKKKNWNVTAMKQMVTILKGSEYFLYPLCI